MDGQQVKVETIRQHRCIKEADFSRIHTIIARLQENVQSFAGELGSWKFFKTVFISLLAIILTATIAAVYQFAQLQSEVTKIQSQTASSNIEKKLDDIQLTLKAIKPSEEGETND